MTFPALARSDRGRVAQKALRQSVRVEVMVKGQVERAVRFVQSKVRVDRFEAVVEAHVMCAARVREKCGIPGTR